MGLYQILERCCLSTSIVTIPASFWNPVTFASASASAALISAMTDTKVGPKSLDFSQGIVSHDQPVNNLMEFPAASELLESSGLSPVELLAMALANGIVTLGLVVVSFDVGYTENKKRLVLTSMENNVTLLLEAGNLLHTIKVLFPKGNHINDVGKRFRVTPGSVIEGCGVCSGTVVRG
ncbi:cytochrome P450 [Artemisia annua]|uniref:Cytochrome P450 n=1 Tax=Artemisia annua TaxID=35608 RepID=A0A2U1KJH6_ARTAN|nr:cytochrome P450 [Artemisia annua]